MRSPVGGAGCGLSQEDARLNRVCQRRVAQLRDDPAKLAELRRQETDWIKQRDQKCGKDAACLKQATKARADYLEQLVAQQEPNPTPGGKIPRECGWAFLFVLCVFVVNFLSLAAPAAAE